MLSTLSQALLVLFLAYAPWHACIFLGARTPIDPGTLSGITWSGLLNALCIIVVTLGLAHPLYKSVRAKTFSRLEWAILAFPAVLILHVKTIDRSSIIAVENGLFLALLTVAALRGKEMASRLTALRALALPVYSLSYAATLLLPLLIPLPNSFQTHKIYQLFFPIERYTGWTNEGLTLAMNGLNLVIFGGLTYSASVQSRHSVKPLAWSLFAMSLGFAGVYLNVLRIALLAIIVFFITSAVFSHFKRNTQARMLFGLLSIMAIISMFTGKFATKSGFLLPTSAESSTSSTTVGRAYVITNGRLETLKLLVAESNGTYLLGQGTGAAPRLLQARNWDPREPQNDFLRIFFEHGIVGLTGFICLGFFVAREWMNGIELSGWLALATVMLTENLLVYPSFGYGPLLLALLIRRKNEF